MTITKQQIKDILMLLQDIKEEVPFMQYDGADDSVGHCICCYETFTHSDNCIKVKLGKMLRELHLKKYTEISDIKIVE